MKINKANVGLTLAAAMNIGGVLTFSRGLTNTVINDFDPVVMSNFGLVMIMVWGLAYLSATTIRSSLRWVGAAFAVEKLVYVTVWCMWLMNNNLADVYDADLFAGIFYTIYGLNDFVFMIFFSWIFVKGSRLER